MVFPLIDETSLRCAWKELAKRIRDFDADVVVQIARKTPRLCEVFELTFGNNCLSVSDLAIPFIHRILRGARVAVVDDVINVGTTLERAIQAVRACGATEVSAFALGRRATEANSDVAADCVWEDPLDEDAYTQLTLFVPTLLLGLRKPYDIEYPLISCRLSSTCTSHSEVMRSLGRSFGESFVTFCRRSSRNNLARFSVHVPDAQPGLRKFRLYVDLESGECNLVPIAIPAHFLLDDSTSNPQQPLARALLSMASGATDGAPTEASVWPQEPIVRATLFAHSLDFGLTNLDRFSNTLTFNNQEPFSVIDAEMLFGPLDVTELSSNLSVMPITKTDANDSHSPFLTFGLEGFGQPSKIIEEVESRAAGQGSYGLFLAFFDWLADAVGASNPADYRLAWPYTAEDIERQPYLRLRIGPTFDDLLVIYRQLTSISGDYRRLDHEDLRQCVSTLLDHAIDMGTLVPTITDYDGTYYRVFRRGERPSHDQTVDRVLYAWKTSGAAMSLTRFSKLNVILAFSREVNPQLLVPESLYRGNVAAFHGTVLDAPNVEIGHYLRDAGMLE